MQGDCSPRTRALSDRLHASSFTPALLRALKKRRQVAHVASPVDLGTGETSQELKWICGSPHQRDPRQQLASQAIQKLESVRQRAAITQAYLFKSLARDVPIARQDVQAVLRQTDTRFATAEAYATSNIMGAVEDPATLCDEDKKHQLPAGAVQIFHNWMMEHFDNPYPSEADKHHLAVAAGVGTKQVANWFSNARVRMWRPVLESMVSENPDLSHMLHEERPN
mmetsp:Transcript_50523/g.118524  ORF Transcript_50523/g.118524 Transcript_50523/m.118524 type:complete len:224 (+) Transcript_50523:290-961(+)